MYEANQLQHALAAAQVGGPVEFRAPSLTEQMTQRKAHLEAQLEEVNKVLAGLEKNPEAAELFNAISRLGGLRY